MKQHILFIDTDKDELIVFLEALKDISVEDGFKCTYATSPTHAAEMLKYLAPDFIFVGPNVSQKDCVDFLSNMRRHTNHSEAPVYIICKKEPGSLAQLHDVSGILENFSSASALRSQLQNIFAPYLGSGYRLVAGI